MSDASPLRSGVLFDYRGRRYERHSADPDSPYERRLALPPGSPHDQLPDATCFGGDPDDPWFTVGAGAIDAAWLRTVRGRWSGCDVLVGSARKAGLLVVHYAGHDPAEADRAGFISTPYQYWHAEVDPSEVEITDVVIEPRPQV